jgi:uncharacterized protein (DUF1697 family)
MADSTAPCVALLRGINVGGKNVLPMRELAEIFAETGCRDVQTYIQSGNVVFWANSKVVKALPGAITKRIEERFGYRVPVVVRTEEQMRLVVGNNPFLRSGVPEDRLHVYFLVGQPAAEDVAQLDSKRSAPDRFAVVGGEIYLELPNGVANTKLTNAYFDSKLTTTCTLRNWRTVLKLIELMSKKC